MRCKMRDETLWASSFIEVILFHEKTTKIKHSKTKGTHDLPMDFFQNSHRKVFPFISCIKAEPLEIDHEKWMITKSQ